MIEYNQSPQTILETKDQQIFSFVSGQDQNIDPETVASFGEEWTKFDHFSAEEIQVAGDQYFDIVTADMLHQGSEVLDAGCGTGRWSIYAAPRAKHIEAIDPSAAVLAAAHFTARHENIRITQASIDQIPFPDNSFDFIFCLGVLHHIPDTRQALAKLVEKLKPGGHILLYLYYSLDNRSFWYKLIFKMSHVVRLVVSSLPKGLKKFVCDWLAFTVYLPLVLLARLLKALTPGKPWYQKLPLSYYVDKSYNIIRNDALDRFGTPLEQRFSRKEIAAMLETVGIKELVFSETAPFWHVVGKKSGK